MNITDVDLEKLKRASATFCGTVKKSQNRKERLTSQIIPLLKPETAQIIIEFHRGVYVGMNQVRAERGTEKAQVPGDNYLLQKHIGDTISDFDHNIYWLEEDNLPALADAMNKNPLIYFSLTMID